MAHAMNMLCRVRCAAALVMSSGVLFWGAGCATTDQRSNRSPSSGRADPAPGQHDQAATAEADRPAIKPHVVAYRDYRDPLMPVNRVMFKINDVTYRYALIPLSKGYLWLMPDPVERGIGNFFQNLREPLYAVNHLLQLKSGRMSRSSLRLVINSTVGLLGIFDPADAWFDLSREETGFDETLGYYGLGYGIYLVLPLFGPSDLRGAAGRVGSYFVSPIPYLTDQPVTTGVHGVDTLQDFAPTADDYNTLRRRSEDPYIFFRNLYLQGVQRDVRHNP